MNPQIRRKAGLMFLTVLSLLFIRFQDLALLLIALDRQAVEPILVIPAHAPTVVHHPLARAVTEELPWEESIVFKELLERHGATLRMAAFAITIPDPLPGELYNFTRAAQIVAGQVLENNDVFSMNGRIGPFDKAQGYQEGLVYIGGEAVLGVGGGVCKMATTLYNVAILADLPILARKNHSMPVSYANPGQDATVSDGGIDLKFKNNTGASIVIWSEVLEHTLIVAFYGQRQPPEITWHHEILQLQKYPSVKRVNPNLERGAERVIFAGAEGITVKSWLTLNYPDGETVIRHLGTDWYRPMPRVVEYAP